MKISSKKYVSLVESENIYNVYRGADKCNIKVSIGISVDDPRGIVFRVKNADDDTILCDCGPRGNNKIVLSLRALRCLDGELLTKTIRAEDFNLKKLVEISLEKATEIDLPEESEIKLLIIKAIEADLEPDQQDLDDYYQTLRLRQKSNPSILDKIRKIIFKTMD